MKSRTVATVGAVAALGAAAVPAVAHHGTAHAHAARTVTVTMGEYFYRPRSATVHVGDRVRFVNAGKIEHTVADSTRRGTILGRVIRPRPLPHGKSQTVAFHRAGTVHYLCTFHPTMMRGRVIVR